MAPPLTTPFPLVGVKALADHRPPKNLKSQISNPTPLFPLRLFSLRSPACHTLPRVDSPIESRYHHSCHSSSKFQMNF
jgi:hypothetical protein